MNRDQDFDMDKVDNVVSFPFGGSERVSPNVPLADFNDPLEELLNEFADWEIDEEEWDLPPPMESDELAALFPPIDESKNCSEVELLAHQIDLLEDITKRMKFYLDEIELFTPNLRR